MSNKIFAHINFDELEFNLSDELIGNGYKYRTLDIGEDLCICLSEEQKEAIFDVIDKTHTKTVDKLEEIIADLEEDLRESNALVTQYSVKEIERRIGH